MEKLSNHIDGMVSTFMLADGKSIDIPTAGQLLNHLEEISRQAKGLNLNAIDRVASGMNSMLEKIVLDSISDQEAAFNLLEKGIKAMQEFSTEFVNTGSCKADPGKYLSELAALTGDAIMELGSAQEPEFPPLQESTEPDTQASENSTQSQATESDQLQDESLVRDFITEGLEYINEIEVNILNLEQNPEDKECVNAIFRPFHSIKGVAGFLNLEQIRNLAHSLENLLDKVRNGELSVNSSIIDVILDGSDALKILIGNIKNQLEGKDISSNVDIESLEGRILASQGGEGKEKVPKKLGTILVEDGIINEDLLQQALNITKQNPEKKLGETLISEGLVSPKQISQALRKQTTQMTDTTSIRVDTSKLDDLIDMVGELVITQTMIRQDPIMQKLTDKKLARNISQLASITSELQRTSTSLRMIPIKQTFQRMARLVRDLSKSVGKTVNVALSGEETEIDRNMVEEIYNPLVHLVRNAIDHGLEKPKERLEAGKPEQGTVLLKAYHRGGTVVIEISDDGKGLDKEKIIAKALSTGILESANGLSDQDIYRLIFLPGLSTAAKVTDVSGRGVGMDVVKQAIDKLRGKIEIQSAPGKGTSFIASFPLTLAIIDGMIIRVGNERYIIPTSAVRQLLRPDRTICSSVVHRGEMINVRGKLMPLIRLHELFEIEPQCRQPWEAI